jgi:hypothetical protein
MIWEINIKSNQYHFLSQELNLLPAHLLKVHQVINKILDVHLQDRKEADHNKNLKTHREVEINESKRRHNR